MKNMDTKKMEDFAEMAFNCLISEYDGVSGFNTEDAEIMKNKVIRFIHNQPKWIPVSERKPKSMANKVIVYLQHEDYVPQIGYGHYEKFKGEEMWYDLENDEQFIKRGYTVTHWMPMPKSPDGEELILY